MDNLFLGMASSFRKLCLGFIQRYLNSSHCFNRQYGQFGHPFRGFRPPNPEMRKKWPISAELPGRFQPNWVAGFVRIPRPTCSESRTSRLQTKNSSKLDFPTTYIFLFFPQQTAEALSGGYWDLVFPPGHPSPALYQPVPGPFPRHPPLSIPPGPNPRKSRPTPNVRFP